MAHHEEDSANLSHEELKYREHTRRASDFMKIDLFLSARGEYERALEYHPGDTLSLEKIDECNSNIRRDRVKVLIIVPFVLALIATIILFNL